MLPVVGCDIVRTQRHARRLHPRSGALSNPRASTSSPSRALQLAPLLSGGGGSPTQATTGVAREQSGLSLRSKLCVDDDTPLLTLFRCDDD